MKLENQVCSLELAQKLKTLGVKQESLFGYCFDGHLDGSLVSYLMTNYVPLETNFAAFTVVELGEMLPTFCDIEGSNRVFNCWKEPQGWQCAYCPHSGSGDWGFQEATTEADARARMLIYLLENNLLPTPTNNK